MTSVATDKILILELDEDPRGNCVNRKYPCSNEALWEYEVTEECGRGCTGIYGRFCDPCKDLIELKLDERRMGLCYFHAAWLQLSPPRRIT